MSETPLRNEDGPRDWVAPPEGASTLMQSNSSRGWRIATLALAATSVVLAMVLAGQLSGQAQLATRGDLSQLTLPLTSPTLPTGEDLIPLVHSIDAQLTSNYSAEAGWPSTITVDAAGTARTSDGIVIGTVPAGCLLTYEAPESGGYSLTLALPSGQSAGVISADYDTDEPQIAEPAPTLGTMAFLLKAQYSGDWPDALSVDAAGNVTTPEGLPLGIVPPGCSFSYTLSSDGSSFELELLRSDATGARYSSVTDRVEQVN